MRRFSFLVLLLGSLFCLTANSPLLAEDAGVPELTQDQKDRALIWAAMGGDLNKVKVALQAGANIRARDAHDRTAMDYALNLGHQELYLWLHEQGVSFITDAPLHPIDWDMPISPITYGLLRRQEERQIVQEASHLNRQSGVGAAWPLYNMEVRKNVPPLPKTGPTSPSPVPSPESSPTPEEKQPAPPEKAPEPAPKEESRVPAPVAEPTPVVSVPDACLDIPAEKVVQLKTWCDEKVFKIKPACVAASCSGTWDIFENKLRCTQCATPDGSNNGFMLMLGTEKPGWDLNSSGQPVAPFNDLLGLVYLCQLPGVKDLSCDTKKELAQKIINP